MDTFHSCCRSVYFYPRPPRGGRLHHSTGQNNWYSNFYPRPPRGGRQSRRPGRVYFYPRPPRGGRLSRFLRTRQCACISIHALREEGDIISAKKAGIWTKFLSTPSARRATPVVPVQNVVERVISIHALREEGDRIFCCLIAAPTHFYPRPPRGGRPVGCIFPDGYDHISIHALREEGDHAYDVIKRIKKTISIHALREEGDTHGARSIRPQQDFYPRPPRGGRLRIPFLELALVKFLSTPSARRATTAQTKRLEHTDDFYPRPPRGGRHKWFQDHQERL